MIRKTFCNMSHFPSAEETGLGLLTHAETLQAVQKVINTKQRSSTYVKYSLSKIFKIGKYASENGSTNAVRKFQNKFSTLKESTIREFWKKYNQTTYAWQCGWKGKS